MIKQQNLIQQVAVEEEREVSDLPTEEEEYERNMKIMINLMILNFYLMLLLLLLIIHLIIIHL